MQKLKNNPDLNFDAIKAIIRPGTDLIVSKYRLKLALQLQRYLEKNDLLGFTVIVDKKLKDFEWMLINGDEIYHSEGTNVA